MSTKAGQTITIAHLQERDLVDAERVRRLAFSAQMGMTDPSQFDPGGSSTGRFYTEPEGAFGAYDEGKLIAVMYASQWGSFGYFGPLAVHPDYWGKGVAQLLLQPTMKFFQSRRVTLSGLFTYANSTKHVSLYQKFGYWPRSLTAIMSKTPERTALNVVTLSSLSESERSNNLNEIDALTDATYPGLSLRKEISSVLSREMGDTVLVYQNGKVRAFAVCHFGLGSEAQTNSMAIKFAAAEPGDDAGSAFGALLNSCESLATNHGLIKVVAGVNTARRPAYKAMLDAEYKTLFLGVAMLEEHSDGFNGPKAFVIDDWR